MAKPTFRKIQDASDPAVIVTPAQEASEDRAVKALGAIGQRLGMRLTADPDTLLALLDAVRESLDELTETKRQLEAVRAEKKDLSRELERHLDAKPVNHIDATKWADVIRHLKADEDARRKSLLTYRGQPIVPDDSQRWQSGQPQLNDYLEELARRKRA